METGIAVEVQSEKPQLKFLDLPFPSEPAAVKILQPVDEDHTFLLNANALEKILKDPKYAHKKVCKCCVLLFQLFSIANLQVCVVGIAGKFRKGKSFLLNFFLRYLNYLDAGSPSEEDWLTREPALEGFSWRGGSERDTNGLLWWSHPFLVKVCRRFLVFFFTRVHTAIFRTKIMRKLSFFSWTHKARSISSRPSKIARLFLRSQRWFLQFKSVDKLEKSDDC